MTWEPIETAPKDGRWFLAIKDQTDISPDLFNWWFAAVMYYDRDKGVFVVAHNKATDFVPQFWQHLPKPPKR